MATRKPAPLRREERGLARNAVPRNTRGNHSFLDEIVRISSHGTVPISLLCSDYVFFFGSTNGRGIRMRLVRDFPVTILTQLLVAPRPPMHVNTPV